MWGAVVRPASSLYPTVTGPSGRTCEFYRRTVGLLSILRTHVCLLSLRSHLFPKSVMQVSTAETHATVIRADCTDDVTAAK
jgi:hypothetical protein